jgi:hypothetical protein
MLVSRWFGSLLLYAALFIAICGFIAIRVRPPRVRSTRVPGAVVVATRAQNVRRIVLWWLPFAVIVGGLLGALWIYGHSVDVDIVTDGPDGPRVDRMVHLGATSFARELAPDDTSHLTDPTWVINQSSITVRVEESQYGSGIGFGSEPVKIPPGTAVAFLHIDDIGPNHPPPRSVESDSVVHMEWRYWLTWGPVTRARDQ